MSTPLPVYVRIMADCLGLRDWDIVISSEHCDADTLAETECTYGQRHAILRFNEKWREWTKDDLRSTVVHELLHVHTEPLSELVSDMNAEALTEEAAKVANASTSYLLERIVDAVSVAIAPYFPYPEDVE